MPNGDAWLSGEDPPEDVYLALLDVLGLRQMIAGNTLREVAKGLRDSRASINAAIPDDIGDKYEPRSIMYSDSMLFWVEGTDEDHLEGLIRTLETFFAALITDGILMRGSVVRGELSVADDQEVIVGQGLVRAYELEQGQKWGGVIVDPVLVKENPSGMQRLSSGGVLVEYEIPWKANPSPRPHTAVCWPSRSGATEQEIRQAFGRWFDPPSEEGRAKFESTVTFFNEYS